MLSVRNLITFTLPSNKGIAGILFTQGTNFSTVGQRKPLTIEAQLGLPERPKKPSAPYFNFGVSITKELSKDKTKPLSVKERSQVIAEKWKQVDEETKSKLHKEFLEKAAAYPAILKRYYDSLTDEQRVQLAAAKQKKLEEKKARALMAEVRKSGKPTRPATGYAMYVKEQHALRKLGSLEESSKTLSEEYRKLSPEIKAAYHDRYVKEIEEYEKKLAKWEEDMIRQGKQHLVRVGSLPASMKTTEISLSERKKSAPKKSGKTVATTNE